MVRGESFQWRVHLETKYTGELNVHTTYESKDISTTYATVWLYRRHRPMKVIQGWVKVTHMIIQTSVSMGRHRHTAVEQCSASVRLSMERSRFWQQQKSELHTRLVNAKQGCLYDGWERLSLTEMAVYFNTRWLSSYDLAQGLWQSQWTVGSPRRQSQWTVGSHCRSNLGRQCTSPTVGVPQLHEKLYLKGQQCHVRRDL